MGTSRDRHVSVLRGRKAPARAMTLVDNGALANMRRTFKSSRFNHGVFPRINLDAVDFSLYQLLSTDVAVADE